MSLYFYYLQGKDMAEAITFSSQLKMLNQEVVKQDLYRYKIIQRKCNTYRNLILIRAIKLARKLRQAPSITVPNLEYLLHVTCQMGIIVSFRYPKLALINLCSFVYFIVQTDKVKFNSFPVYVAEQTFGFFNRVNKLPWRGQPWCNHSILTSFMDLFKRVSTFVQYGLR